MGFFEREMFDLSRGTGTASAAAGATAEKMAAAPGPAGSGNAIASINRMRNQRHEQLETVRVFLSNIGSCMEMTGSVVSRYEGANEAMGDARREGGRSAESNYADPSSAIAELRIVGGAVNSLTLRSLGGRPSLSDSTTPSMSTYLVLIARQGKCGTWEK